MFILIPRQSYEVTTMFLNASATVITTMFLNELATVRLEPLTLEDSPHILSGPKVIRVKVNFSCHICRLYKMVFTL